MAGIIVRAKQAGIINEETYQNTFKFLSQAGLRKDERSGLIPEETHLLPQLVYRAVSEGEINELRAAELLQVPVDDVHSMNQLTLDKETFRPAELRDSLLENSLHPITIENAE